MTKNTIEAAALRIIVQIEARNLVRKTATRSEDVWNVMCFAVVCNKKACSWIIRGVNKDLVFK